MLCVAHHVSRRTLFRCSSPLSASTGNPPLPESKPSAAEPRTPAPPARLTYPHDVSRLPRRQARRALRHHAPEVVLGLAARQPPDGVAGQVALYQLLWRVQGEARGWGNFSPCAGKASHHMSMTCCRQVPN